MKLRTMLKLIAAMLIGLLSTMSWATAGEKVTLYKNPQCMCCEIYAQYLRDNGFDVTVVPTNDLASMHEARGIPAEMQGCHLSMVNGRAISGHVPVDIVRRFLAEKPSNMSISLPGMPAGGPGMMPGEKTGPYTVYSISDGKSAVYATE